MTDVVVEGSHASQHVIYHVKINVTLTTCFLVIKPDVRGDNRLNLTSGRYSPSLGETVSRDFSTLKAGQFKDSCVRVAADISVMLKRQVALVDYCPRSAIL